MAIRKPVVIGADGLLQQLQTGDSVSVPTSGGEAVQLTNANATPAVKGASMYPSAAGSVDKARANAAGTSKCIGLVADTSIANGAAGTIQVDGILTATTAEWDAVAGTSGGLAVGAAYFLDPATAGKITATPPTTVGQYNVRIGRALSTVDMLIQVEDPILL